MIVPMKKVRLYAFFEDRACLLAALQRRSLLMITDDGDESGVRQHEDFEKNAQKLYQAAEALSFAGGFRDKKSMFAQKPKMEFDSLILENEEDEDLAKSVLSIKSGIQAAESRIQTLNAANAVLAPWRRLDILPSELKDTRSARVRIGFFPERAIMSVGEIEELGGSVELFDAGSSGTAALLVTHRSFDSEVMEKADELGFAETALLGLTTTAAAAFSNNVIEIREKEIEIEDLKRKAAEASEKMEALQRLSDREAAGLARSEISYGATEAVFYIDGWVRSDRERQLKEAVEGVTEHYSLEIRDPFEDETPPTQTKNNRFIAQFEVITDMFSRPGSRDIVDPNTVMGIWYWVIFGMMMGDVGYGALMLLFTGAFKLLTKRNIKLVNVIFYSGFTTVFWGVMFGSYFGEELALIPAVIVAPLDDIMTLMIICLGIGALHVFSGIGMQMYINIKQGRVLDALLDQLSSIVLVIGLALFFVDQTVGAVVAGVSCGVLLVTGGRSKPTITGKVVSGLTGIYGTVTGLVSDILSYARILALMLSSGIVAMVMNMLAGMVMPSQGSGILGYIIGGIFGVTIYIVGHVFNLALGLLSAYVHDSRLQYLEFFGKFYEGGGYAFRPLSPNTKYIEIEESVQKIA